jgi:hypothetical protein
MDWMVGFVDTSYTLHGATRNYISVADLYTLQFTVTHTRFFIFTSRILATDFKQSLYNYTLQMSRYYSTY